MKVLFRWIKEKISGIWTKAVVPHARICMISGAVVAVAGASAITAVEYINYNNKTQIQAKETEAEMQEETQTHNNVEQTKPVVMETEEESTEEETYQVIENIMTKVVKDSTVTQKEDPIKNRNNESSGEVIKPVSYVDNAVSGSVSVSSVKKSGDDIVYTVKSRKAKDFTEKQIAGCVKGSVLVQENEQENKLRMGIH